MTMTTAWKNLRSCRWFAAITICAVLGASWTSIGAAQENAALSWPQFLGPDRNGISQETGLSETWPDAGPPELWRVAGGVGLSGLAIADGRVITLVQKDGQQVALALQAETGQTLWSTAIGEAYENGMGDGPRATPTLAGEHAYVYTGDGILAALNINTGDIVWRQNVLQQSGAEIADYGMAGSPLVVGDAVVVTVGGKGTGVVAVDRQRGTVRWKAADGPAGYSSPALLEIAGAPQIVSFLGQQAVGVDAASGRLLWRYPYATDFDCNIATPLARGGQLFLSSGENHGCVLLAFDKSGDQLKPRTVWESQGARSVLRNEWQTSILLGDHLYGLDNVGSAGPVTHLTCVEFATGKRVWQQPRFGKANLIAADGKLFFSSMEGELVLVRATPEAYTELGRAKVMQAMRQAPALAGGRLYLRDNRHIACFDVRAAQ
jgi:outer membrane protein assembly factor BamB